MTPEQKARVSIDALLIAAGWHVCKVSAANIHAATGVAIREFPLNPGFGFADYLLYVNGKACGVIEAKKQGATLTGVELQSGRYAQGLPTSLPAWRRPLSFVWESTGVETHFTNGLDPEPRARAVFAFFRPELLVQWLAYLPTPVRPELVEGQTSTDSVRTVFEPAAPATFLARMQHMPKLVTDWGSGGAHYALWPAQISAITNLEKSLAANKPKALIQMATGSGKTFTSIGFIYRLIKFGGARRVLFLVDRGNLARQTKKEFDAYASPYNNYKFGEEYIVQHLQGNQLDTSARVVNRYEPQAIGEYLSALANSACLLGKPRGYLVFGIEDGTHAVVGTSFDPQAEVGQGNQLLPLWLALGLKPKLGFEIHSCQYHGQRVVVFEVHPAFDRPVEFYGKAFVRNGTSKTALAGYPEKERAIWTRRVDWSAQVCEQATLADLDPLAIAEARRQFAEKNKTKPDRLAELAEWDDATFLNKAKLTVRGSVTHAALLLLGREESTSLLAPAVARISWILKNERNEELDYEHFGPPLLLNVNKVLARVRNLTVRELPDGTLFPVELTQYDPWVIREALHNCIAHQDYGLRGRVQVVETPHALLLTNVGGFLPGRVETVIDQDAPLEIYRNPYLAEAMVSLNMIDTQGGGIKRMFQTQRRRFFPMPDYDLTQPERVMVTLRGRILDVRYTRLLMAQGELDLGTIMLLDKVQKGQRIDPDEAKRLKTAKLVEGRYPNLLVAGSVAAVAGQKAQHIRYRGFDSQYYRDMIVALVREHQPVSREDIDRLLLDKLPEVLSQAQKLTKIHNLLSSQSGKTIRNAGSRTASQWVLMD